MTYKMATDLISASCCTLILSENFSFFVLLRLAHSHHHFHQIPPNTPYIGCFLPEIGMWMWNLKRLSMFGDKKEVENCISLFASNIPASSQYSVEGNQPHATQVAA